jgi:hypothetical protein
MTQLYIPEHLETAFEKDFSTKDEENNIYRLYSFQVGHLRIKDGRIVACDPFLYNNDKPFTTAFPTGTFPVQLAVAQIRDDERVAFARIIFSDEVPFSWTLAVCDGQDISQLREGEIFGYDVDAGTGAFMDTTGAVELMSFMTTKEDNYQVLINEMEKNYKDTWDYLMWQQNDSNVAMFKSGWGDGVYATYIGYDKTGNICRLVTDFAVID